MLAPVFALPGMVKDAWMSERRGRERSRGSAVLDTKLTRQQADFMG